MRLDHVRLLVSDFDACFCFYRDTMGLESHWGEEGGIYASFQMHGKIVLALFCRDLMAETMETVHLPANPDGQDRVALIFEVEDIEETAAQLRARGVQFVNEPQDYPDWTIRAAHLRDPDGNLIELSSALPRSKWTERVAEEAEKYRERDSAPA